METVNIRLGVPQKCRSIVQLCVEGEISPPLEGTSFRGLFLETACAAEAGGVQIWVGLGKEELDATRRMELFGRAADRCREMGVLNIAVEMGGLYGRYGADIVDSAVQGLTLGLYSYTLKKEEPITWEIGLRGLPDSAEALLTASRNVAAGVCFARDLINTPANRLRPETMAMRVTEELAPLGVECETLHRDRLADLGMNGLLTVGDSTGAFPPCLLVLRYRGAEGAPAVLVGKGVTYDTGGYCLKPAGSMATMKCDMSGAAAVAGALLALAANRAPVHAVGVLPLCENRISESCAVPGDVYTAYGGKTVEILNTDAEGRLVLADAVTYAVTDLGAAAVVDIATLTGAAHRTFGHGVSPALTNNEALWERFRAASVRSGERFWLMPTYPEYHKMIEGDITDLKNMGEPVAGTITGGLFVGSFAGDTPWLHLDIAGAAYLEKPLFAFQKKGGTGVGTASLYRYLADGVPERISIK